MEGRTKASKRGLGLRREGWVWVGVEEERRRPERIVEGKLLSWGWSGTLGFAQVGHL